LRVCSYSENIKILLERLLSNKLINDSVFVGNLFSSFSITVLVIAVNLLSDKFYHVIKISVCIGTLSAFLGTYLSYFIGGVIVLLQAFVFVLAFIFAPKHGLLASYSHRQVSNLVTDKNIKSNNIDKIKDNEASNAFI